MLNRTRPNGWKARVALLIIISVVCVDAIISRPAYMSPVGIVVHHSALDPDDGISQIAELHRKKKLGTFFLWRYYTVGYHYLIYPDGSIEQTRPEFVRGSHTRGHNDWIGICVLGNFDSAYGSRIPTVAQLESLARLSQIISRRHGWEHPIIRGHKQLDPGHTLCPGDNWDPEREISKRWASP
jgi:N-acetylmuramoyl-L-alanine amidase